MVTAMAGDLTEVPGSIFTLKSPVNKRVLGVLCNLSSAESYEVQPAPARHKRGLLWRDQRQEEKLSSPSQREARVL